MDPVTGLPTPDVDKGYYGNNNPTNNFNGLLEQISLYNTYYGTSLLNPTFTSSISGSNNTVNLTGFDYAVIHYGTGSGGQGQGGGIEFFYLNGLTGNFVFPSVGLGPNGVGGFSSIRLFSVGGVTPVSENSVTMLLLGMVAVGLLATRRFIPA
jgi:hypothetical protein